MWGPLIFMVMLAGAGAWVLVQVSKPAEAQAGPPPGMDPDTGEPRGSPQDLATKAEVSVAVGVLEQQQWQKGFARNVGSGFLIGMQFGGPIGGFVGAWIAGVATVLQRTFAGEGPPPRKPLLPYEEIGMPYWPQMTRHDSRAGEVTIRIPSRDNWLIGQDFVFQESALRDRIQGPGAFEACKSSGMFAWRPFDVPTPFAELLYENAPWLLAYEDHYIRTTPDDFSDPNDSSFHYRWKNILGVPAEPIVRRDGDTFIANEDAFRRMIIMARRLAAWRELQLPRSHWLDLTFAEWGDRIGTVCCTKLEPNDMVLRARNICEWLFHAPAENVMPPQGNLAVRTRQSRLLQALAGEIDAPILTCSPRVNDRCDLVPIASWTTRGTASLTNHYTPAGSGLPGAWRLRPDVEPQKTNAQDAALSQSLQDVILLGGDSGAKALRQTSTGAPGGGVAIDSGSIGGVVDRPAPDPENAFVFECWLPAGRAIVSSWFFWDLPELGSHAAVMRGLTGGAVAWSTADRLSAAMLERWSLFDKSARTVAANFVGKWRPFA